MQNLADTSAGQCQAGGGAHAMFVSQVCGLTVGWAMGKLRHREASPVAQGSLIRRFFSQVPLPDAAASSVFEAQRSSAI